MNDDVITIRPARVQDGPSLFAVLAQLTEAPVLPEERLEKILAEEESHGLRRTLVAVDSSDKVIGTGAILFEQKLSRGGGICAHIEDIVIDKSIRGKSVGKQIISALVDLAREKRCYKVILDCADENVGFYEKCGFVAKERQMALYLTDIS